MAVNINIDIYALIYYSIHIMQVPLPGAWAPQEGAAMLYTILLVIIILLGVLVYGTIFGRKEVQVQLTVEAEQRLRAVIDEIEANTRHYADVSAVVAMVRQINNDPELLDELRSYPEEVSATAWLHYINVLGSTLQTLQNREGEVLKAYSPSSSDAKHAQNNVKAAREKLDEAIEASGLSGLRVV